MENASEALYIAFAVMVFVLALTLTITSFSSLRETASSIIERDEVLDLVTDDTGNYINYIQGNPDSTNRIVGIETIIPSMYRAYKENYKIIFKFKESVDCFESHETGEDGVYYIDLKDENYATSNEAKSNLDEILKNGLYDYLKDKTFKEELGQYYIEDEGKGVGEDFLDVNKTLKRIITYTEEK